MSNRPLRLPDAPPRYDQADQDNVRRLLTSIFQQANVPIESAPPADFSSLTINPGPLIVGTADPGGTEEVRVLGSIRATSQLVLSLVTGTAPMVIASQTMVPNLNADFVDGLHAAAFALVGSPNTFSGLQTFGGGISIPDGVSITFAANVSGGGLAMGNKDITNVNNIQIGDPGPNEGISWAGGNLWKIYESPNDLATNSLGNLQIVQNTTRRATFNTSGQLELPVATGTAPLLITSTTLVTNLNADLLDSQDGAFYQNASNLNAGNLAYARLPTGGGTWANGGTLSITGGVTTLAGLVSSADITAQARLVFTTAAGKIVPGATSLSHRNNADTADNLLIADAGGITIRNSLTSAGNCSFAAGNTAKILIDGTDGVLASGEIGLAENVGELWIGARSVIRLLMDDDATATGSVSISKGVQGSQTLLWTFDINGHLTAGTDNAQDIGASAATRPRTLYLGTSALIGTIASGGLRAYYGASDAATTASDIRASSTNNLIFSAAAGGDLYLNFDHGNLIRIAGTGLIFHTDNSIDIGTGGANRPRSVYIGSSLFVEADTAGQPVLLTHLSNSPGLTAAVVGRRARTGLVAVAQDDVLTGLYGQGYQSGGAYSANVAAIRFAAAEAFTATNQGSYIDFATTSIGAIARTIRWLMNAPGHLITGADNTYDIGDATHRPRTGYFGTSIVIGTDPGGPEALRVAGTTRLNSNVGVGVAAASITGLRVNGAILSGGTIQQGIRIDPTFDSGATAEGRVLFIAGTTAAAVYTMASMQGLRVADVAKGAGSIITTQYGVLIDNQTQGATNYALFTGTGDVSLGDRLVLRPASSKIVPGATSLSLRNNADSADNILIADAGAITFRGGLSGITTLSLSGAQSGGTTLSLAGPITLTTAASKIIPGATSLALRNNADNANNLLLTDAGVATLRNDLVVDVLGTFDHTGTRFTSGAGPVADDLMSWHGSAGKWRPRFLQTAFTSGAAVSQNNTDTTFATFYNSGPALSGVPVAPVAAPVVTALYKATLIDMSAYALGGTQVYVLDYSINGAAYTSGRIVSTSAKVIHSSLDPTKTYAYKYLIRGASDSAYGPASGAINPSTTTEANAFGLIVASQIATAYLSAINANIGSITAGQLISGDGKSILQLDSTFSVPAAVTQGIFFASANPVPGTVTGAYLDFTATGTNPVLHHTKLDLRADGSAQFGGQIDINAPLLVEPPGYFTYIRFRDPDVAHGMTTRVATDVLGTFGQISPTDGGFWISGFSETQEGLQLFGYEGIADSGVPAVIIQGFKKSGTGTVALGANEMEVQLGTQGIAVFGDGAVQLRSASTKIYNAGTSITFRNTANSADNLAIADAGDLTARTKLTMPGPLVLTTAASKIVPGATSFSHRNNADSADNLIILDAGDATFRTKVTLPGPVVFTTAASKIVPGATSLSHRNNADSADNLIILDAGDATFRTKVTLPGPVVFTTAVSKIVPGATSLSLRNNADSADNLIILDAGDATFRTKVTLPGPVVFTTAASKIVPGATSLSLRNNADSADNILIADAGDLTFRTFYDLNEIAAPATPAANKTRDYSKDASGVSKRYWKDDAGVEHPHNLTLIDSQTFTANGTWTKPAGAVLVRVEVIGGGGGGGGGRGGAVNSARNGGGGGGGGARTTRWWEAGDLGATETLVVGGGGTAGTGGSAADGTDGGAGGNSSFGTTAIQWAFGGGGGFRGNNAANTGGSGGGSMAAGLVGTAATTVLGGRPASSVAGDGDGYGGASADFSGGGAHGRPAVWGGASGGSGGSGGGATGWHGGVGAYSGGGGAGGGDVTAANVQHGGGDGGGVGSGTIQGGGAGGAAGGTAGAAGANGDSKFSGKGGGGGGGNSNSAGPNGGAGGAGGTAGGGGGGGGGGTTVGAGGAGGVGGRGEVRVYTYA